MTGEIADALAHFLAGCPVCTCESRRTSGESERSPTPQASKTRLDAMTSKFSKLLQAVHDGSRGKQDPVQEPPRDEDKNEYHQVYEPIESP